MRTRAARSANVSSSFSLDISPAMSSEYPAPTAPLANEAALNVRLPAAALAAAPLVCVEMPVLASRPSTLATLLGGSNGGAALRDEAVPLRLWLRPDDPLSHALVSSPREPTAGFLLRVRRARPRSTDVTAVDHTAGAEEPPAPCTASLVGVVGATYRFPGLADFQFLPSGGVPISPATSPNFIAGILRGAESVLEAAARAGGVDAGASASEADVADAVAGATSALQGEAAATKMRTVTKDDTCATAGAGIDWLGRLSGARILTPDAFTTVDQPLRCRPSTKRVRES